MHQKARARHMATLAITEALIAPDQVVVIALSSPDMSDSAPMYVYTACKVLDEPFFTIAM